MDIHGGDAYVTYSGIPYLYFHDVSVYTVYKVNKFDIHNG